MSKEKYPIVTQTHSKTDPFPYIPCNKSDSLSILKIVFNWHFHDPQNVVGVKNIPLSVLTEIKLIHDNKEANITSQWDYNVETDLIQSEFTSPLTNTELMNTICEQILFQTSIVNNDINIDANPPSLPKTVKDLVKYLPKEYTRDPGLELLPEECKVID